MQTLDFVSRANSEYIDQLYRQYQKDPASVPASWRAFFMGFEVAGEAPKAMAATAAVEEQLRLLGVQDLVHSYRELGHLIANLDPLGHNRTSLPLLELSQFDMTSADLDRKVGSGGFLGPADGTLRDLIEKLKATYCRTFAVEYMLIPDKSQRDWLAARMEPIYNRPELPAGERRAILAQLVEAQGFEEFLATKYIGAKRFSLEGADAFIPVLNTLIEDGAGMEMDEMVIGMAHRGRLNALAHVLHKPYEVILSEFEGYLPEQNEGVGDVKYHLGYPHDRIARNGRKVHVGLTFNPSHLELVNPVVEGIVRAKQTHYQDNDRTHIVPVLVHGDAAFTGQGIVLETLALSEMPYWRTGGTIHILLNNQVGFTTMPKQGRFTTYPTDVAKTIQAPIFHVNGDDPEACIHAAKLAMAFRQQFHSDVFIDLWCYRRWGHNEVDEPSFTQPLMYKEIATHTPVRDLYQRQLEAEGVVSADEVSKMKATLRERLEKAMAVAKVSRPPTPVVALQGLWTGMTQGKADGSIQTSISESMMQRIAEDATRLPPDFTLHPKLKRFMQGRREMGSGKSPIDWGGAEMFALGSLVLEGTPVRFVGQDTQRGTFSHRHACLHDYNTGRKYYPLANLDPNQAPIIILNTMLSELAVLGFEYGFASADPRNLVVWEAQFGDFVNGAQPIIDQFIAASESKWQKYCGLVMLLPHGYEGQGPEHSYGYLDRFLALCAEENMQVCQASLPAQYFHVLRRQMKRNFRKPLILLMPKSLLRSEASTSHVADFVQGSFQLVIDDPKVISRERVRRLLLCSGKA
ncbi:MAG TPA: 2-oxoglutarate dehydrogenase E1 component [Tepidisphaeraceae bacterium]|nr:2-oxoglutarate dehydrogenase E1 component [Tepidisphaeraceae bacterium]